MASLLPKRLRRAASDPQYQPTPSGSRQTFAIPPHVRLLALLTLLSFALSLASGWLGSVFHTMRWIMLVALVVAAGLALWRIARQDLLWRLRNKLVLTYLLVGLAPVLLFFILVFLTAYVSAGQFAIHLATSHLHAQLDAVAQQNGAVARHAAVALEHHPDAGPLILPELHEAAPTRLERGMQMAVFQDGKPVSVDGLTGHARTPLVFVSRLQQSGMANYRGIVQDGTLLYLAAASTVRNPLGGAVTVISSVPLDRERVVSVATGLGRVDLLPGLEVQPQHTPSTAELQQARISAGVPPDAANILDLKVRFFSTLPVQEWETGDQRGVPLNVESRPSVLYDELFATAAAGQTTDTVRLVFFAVVLLFAALEGTALYMANRLSRTVTESVEDLYAATISIDRGDLQHRIAVERTDQLADLCRSFNRMSWSLGRLIDQQKEKERIESELSIAQEVQANLFPLRTPPMDFLDLHGICRPARTVSGDYYDFLTFDKAGRDGSLSDMREVTGVGIALGDISGKGISAALLMATLHSAVRAYRFASEELLTPAALASTAGESEECSELFLSPGRVLGLLNRHLYRSTTPEKYATLFLAHYDRSASRLTYSNAGQLPPFVLRADDTLERLERGGTVVGLIDGATYEEGSLRMHTGDILIAYSDGVTEPENDFGDFGEDRLIEVVRQFRREPLAVISAEVMRALDAWIGDGEQPDDITLVLARQA